MWYCYETVNNVNGKYYRGKSGSNNPECDGYLGSGTMFLRALRKYGKENFTKKILATFETEQEAFEYEAKIVTLKEVQDPQCYNMQLGGQGGTKGAIYIHKGDKIARILPENLMQFLEAGWEKGSSNKWRENSVRSKIGIKKRGHKQSLETREKISKALKGVPKSPEHIKNNSLSHLGKSHPGYLKGRKWGPEQDERRRELSERMKGHPGWNKGKPGTMKGKHHTAETLRKIRENSLDRIWITNGIVNKHIKKTEPVPEGWHKGMHKRKAGV